LRVSDRKYRFRILNGGTSRVLQLGLQADIDGRPQPLELVVVASDAGLLAAPVRDTMKRADADGRVSATVDRAALWHALTPQMFRLHVLLNALEQALEQGLLVTDDAAAVEALGLAPRLVEGRADNIKITRPEDLALAEFYLTHSLG
jgi:2-C-methyl-D-erythritol 4-phosphate cytidylyltransferase